MPCGTFGQPRPFLQARSEVPTAQAHQHSDRTPSPSPTPRYAAPPQAALGAQLLNTIRSTLGPSIPLVEVGEQVLTTSVFAILVCANVGVSLIHYLAPRWLHRTVALPLPLPPPPHQQSQHPHGRASVNGTHRCRVEGAGAAECRPDDERETEERNQSRSGARSGGEGEEPAGGSGWRRGVSGGEEGCLSDAGGTAAISPGGGLDSGEEREREEGSCGEEVATAGEAEAEAEAEAEDDGHTTPTETARAFSGHSGRGGGPGGAGGSGGGGAQQRGGGGGGGGGAGAGAGPGAAAAAVDEEAPPLQ